MMRDVYSASTTLYVLVSEDSSQMESYSTLSTNFNVSQQIANDISQLIMSTRVRMDTAEALGWNSLGGYGISVASGDDSRVVRVIASGADPEGVAEVANAVAGVASEVAQEVMNVQSVNVLDRAMEPMMPSGPNRPLYVAVAFLGGLFAACAGIVVADMLDTRVHDAKTAEEISGISELGAVPEFGKGGRGQGAGRSEEVLGAQDSMKTLLTNLMFLGVDEPIKTIAVTSSMEGEGKSTIDCLLAQAIAMSGQSVLLVEGDLRRCSLAGILGVRAFKGLGEVLHGTPVERVIRRTSQQNLFFLNAEPDIPNPTEIISSKRFRELVANLREKFAFVVIDTPPLGMFADASVVASLADATLLVVRDGYTQKAALSMASEQLKKAGASVVGLALNCGEKASKDSCYGYGYGYGYARRRSGKEAGDSVARLAFDSNPGPGAHGAER